MISIENALLSIVIQDEEHGKEKLSLLNRDWFEDKNLFDNVEKYKADNNPYDPILIMQSMGTDLYSVLLESTTPDGISRWDMYYAKFRALQAQRGVFQKASTLELTAEDCREAAKLLENEEIDDRDYDLKDDLTNYIERLEKRIVGDVEWYNLGIPALDRCLGHIRPKDMIVISGKGGLGKTTLGLKIFDFLIKQNVPGIVFSSEMDYDSTLDKLIALNTGLNSNHIRNGKISRENMSLITEKIHNNIYDKKGRIIETTLKSADAMKDKILKHKSKFVIIDNIQRFWIGDLRGINKADYLEEIAKRIKDISMELGVFSVVLSQVNDANELRGSKGIYNNSDYVINLELKEETPSIKRIKINIDKGRFCSTPNFDFIMNKTTGDFTEEEQDTTKSIWSDRE